MMTADVTIPPVMMTGRYHDGRPAAAITTGFPGRDSTLKCPGETLNREDIPQPDHTRISSFMSEHPSMNVSPKQFSGKSMITWCGEP